MDKTMVKSALKEVLKKILEELSLQDIEPEITRTAKMSNGDYATNIAPITTKNLTLCL